MQTGDIKQANGLIGHYNQTYSEEGLKQSRLWPAGTLCITIAANIADTAILGFDACFPDSVVGFLSEKGQCNIRFVEFFLRTAKEDLERYAPATAQKNINLGTLKGLAIPFPPLFEQNVITEEIDRRLSLPMQSKQLLMPNSNALTRSVNLFLSRRSLANWFRKTPMTSQQKNCLSVLKKRKPSGKPSRRPTAKPKSNLRYLSIEAAIVLAEHWHCLW